MARKKGQYCPDSHDKHNKEYTTGELAYMCQMWHYMTNKDIGLALGRTEATITTMISSLKRKGEFEKYKNMEV